MWKASEFNSDFFSGPYILLLEIQFQSVNCELAARIYKNFEQNKPYW